MEDDKYPQWLGDLLLNNTFDWKNSTKITMEHLLEHVTLHDSVWYNTCLEQGSSWLLIISLDAIWNKEFCYYLEDWPFLVIRVSDVLSAFLDFHHDDSFYQTIGSADATSVNIKDFKEWTELGKSICLYPNDFYRRLSSMAKLTRTEITTIYGGTLALIHSSEISVLLYTESGEKLSINLPAFRKD